MKRIITTLKENIIWIGLFIIIVFLCYLFPYTGDDWAWGSVIGLDRLNSFFDNYNGRYFGNFTVLALTRSVLLKTIVMALVYTGIIYFISKCVKIKKTYTILLIIILITLMPVGIFRESVSWVSGFSNYVMPTLGIIFIIYYYFKGGFKTSDKISKRIIIAISLCLLSFSVSLFMEHITIYNLILSIFLVVYTAVKSKPNLVKSISYLLGSLIGTITMFSNSAYTSIFSHADGYRDIAEPSTFNFINTLVDKILNLLIYDNYIIIGIIITLLIYIVPKTKTKQNKTTKKILCMILSFSLFYIVITNIFPDWNILLEQTKYFELFLGIILLITIIISLFYIKQTYRNKILFLLISIIILTGPLLFVEPIGPRCFFIIYIFYILISLILIEYMKNVLKFNFGQGIKTILLGGALCSAIYIFSIYGYIHIKDNERLIYIKENMKYSSSVVFHRLPYEDRLHCSYLGKDNSVWEMRYKLFNNIPDDIDLIYEK